MNIKEAKELYQKTTKNRNHKDYRKVISNIKKGISLKEEFINVETISKHIIDLLIEDGYEVKFINGDERDPESCYYIGGWA